MLRAARPQVLCGALAAAVALAVAAPAQPTLARLSLVESRVEQEKKGARWRSAVEGAPFAVGEALRTGPGAIARLDLPWMALTLGAGTSLRFPDAFLLSATLERGRLLVEAETADTLTIVTAEAEVRGRGRAVVRREGRTTLVTCLAGRFVVSVADRATPLETGQGTVARAGRPAATSQAPPAPVELWPAQDPVYVAPGEPIELRWNGGAASYQVEVLPVGAEIVLIQRDVGASSLRLELPWEGAFRWRVSARDGRGLEGLPSTEGLIAVDPK